MIRTLSFLASLVVASSLVACAAPADDEPAPVPASAEQGLSSSATGTSIGKAFEFFTGAKASLTNELHSAALPDDVRSAITKARRAVFADMANENLSNDDVEANTVYAVFTDSTKRKQAGYALWVFADNGSLGMAHLVGFDMAGNKVLAKSDAFQDDGDR